MSYAFPRGLVVVLFASAGCGPSHPDPEPLSRALNALDLHEFVVPGQAEDKSSAQVLALLPALKDASTRTWQGGVKIMDSDDDGADVHFDCVFWKEGLVEIDELSTGGLDHPQTSRVVQVLGRDGEVLRGLPSAPGAEGSAVMDEIAATKQVRSLPIVASTPWGILLGSISFPVKAGTLQIDPQPAVDGQPRWKLRATSELHRVTFRWDGQRWALMGIARRP